MWYRIYTEWHRISDEVKYMSLFSSIDKVIKNHNIYNDNYTSYYNTNLF